MNQLTLSSPMISCEHLKYRQHVWLYASAYGPTWWIYDRYNQRVIETAYQDYLRREGAPSTRSQSTQVSMEEIFPTPSSSVTSELSYEPVHFQNPVSEAGARRASFSESESEDEDQYLHLYLFQIGGVEYRLDFDQMKQVNTINVHKFRKIKRFQLETQLGTHELHQHLQERAQVLGVAGLKF